ncbi:MAG: membrane-bound lytic murein transglycosylase MltF [Cellvibrionaceae bacterium]
MTRLLALFFVVLLHSGCSDSNNQDTGNTHTGSAIESNIDAEDLSFIETGDLEQLQERGQLRLLAPRFDGADALPREGVTVENYQRIAEAFAENLGLKASWVFVDEFSELIPSLNRGEGDLIVTNMTVTLPRLENVHFSRSINKVNEVVVTHKDISITSLEELTGIALTIPEGTAYVESIDQLETKKNLKFSVNTVDSTTSDSDLLSMIDNAQQGATLLDSDIAKTLLLDYPDLHVAFTLKKHRPIAWATRKSSPNLLNNLNKFLVSHHLQSSANEHQHRDWKSIQQHGRLRMLTLNNPASYFMWRGELMGFDLDLVNAFAKQNGLHVSVIIKDDIDQLIAALKNGEGDMIAASLTKTQARQQQGLNFSRPYLKVSEQLVGREGNKSINNWAELENRIIGVNPSTVFYQRLIDLKKSHPNITLQKEPGLTTENLIDQMMSESFYATVADSHLLAIEQAHREDLKVLMELNQQSDIAWALRPDQPNLKEQLDRFIKKEYRGLFYNVTFNKYFKNSRRMKAHKADRVTDNEQLSPYDHLVKPLAEKYAMDWRLLIAQMYQESKFNPKAKSFAGALGLMQVMPRTAREMGYKDLHTPSQGIEAGIAYMHWLEARFPGELDFQERIFFTLAAYNAGAGHVRDARRLAKQQGLDPNRWFDHVEKAMLMLSKPEYYKKARFGYVRGSEPVHYVKAIRDRYLGYLQI